MLNIGFKMKRIIDKFFNRLEELLDMPDAFELEEDENDILD